jgi:hypothetical protein
MTMLSSPLFHIQLRLASPAVPARATFCSCNAGAHLVLVRSLHTLTQKRSFFVFTLYFLIFKKKCLWLVLNITDPAPANLLLLVHQMAWTWAPLSDPAAA